MFQLFEQKGSGSTTTITQRRHKVAINRVAKPSKNTSSKQQDIEEVTLDDDDEPTTSAPVQNEKIPATRKTADEKAEVVEVPKQNIQQHELSVEVRFFFGWERMALL